MDPQSECIITKVEPEAKRKSYYWIYIDEHDEAEVSVHEDILIKYRLLKGSSLTREKLEEIQSESGRYRA